MQADLVLFDPDTILDRATTDHPHDIAQGIDTVWVNGSAVWHDHQTTDRRPGKVLRRPK
jgi:N-acyl-D-amino-acid deacylase